MASAAVSDKDSQDLNEQLYRMIISSQARPEAIRSLIQDRADVNYRHNDSGEEGVLMLDVALLRGKGHMIKILEEHGAFSEFDQRFERLRF